MSPASTKISEPWLGPIPSLRPFTRRDCGKRSLFLRPDTGAWVVVEGVGAELIESCDGARDACAIAGLVAERYGVDAPSVQADVDGFLVALRRAGLFRNPSVEPCHDSKLEGLALHVTTRCPLNCRHCYASPAADTRHDPPLDLLASAVEQARDLGAGIFKVTGGDPLARPDVLQALQRSADGAAVTILTSGMAPADQLRALLVENRWVLQISLDGADAETHDWYRGPGSHERLKRNLDDLSADNLLGSVTLCACLSRINRHQIEAIVQQAIDWGVGSMHLARVSRHGRAEEHWSELSLDPDEWAETYLRLADVHRRYSDDIRLTGFLIDNLLSCVARPDTRGCVLGRHVMMDLDGLIYPCVMMGKRETCLGDLRTDTLADILAAENLSAIRRACHERLTDVDVCGTCNWRMICRGACPGWPLVQDGTLKRTDDLCGVRRELFPRILFELAEGPGDRPPATPCPD